MNQNAGPSKARPDEPLIDAVFRALDSAASGWCLLRGSRADPGGSGDVDLLIAPSDIPRLTRALSDLEFVQLPWWGNALHPHFLGYDERRRRWIWLDVATELAFGAGYRLRAGVALRCLARRERSDGLPHLARDDRFWALLLHCLLDKGTIAERHRDELASLASDAGDSGPLASVVAGIIAPVWEPDDLVDRARNRDWMALEAMAPELARMWEARGEVSHPGMLARGRSWAAALWRGARYRGVSVALLGPDGAGKSTLGVGLQESFPLPARIIYMGLYSRWLNRAARLRFPPVVALGRLAVFWGRYALARYHQARGRLVIFDRYAFDALLPSHDGVNGLIRWVDAHACPAPDVTLFLDAPGDLMYRRKGARKHTPQELALARDAYLALAWRIPRLTILDASADRERVRMEAIAAIWRAYQQRLGEPAPPEPARAAA
jgi:thymidylate kinase